MKRRKRYKGNHQRIWQHVHDTLPFDIIAFTWKSNICCWFCCTSFRTKITLLPFLICFPFIKIKIFVCSPIFMHLSSSFLCSVNTLNMNTRFSLFFRIEYHIFAERTNGFSYKHAFHNFNYFITFCSHTYTQLLDANVLVDVARHQTKFESVAYLWGKFFATAKMYKTTRNLKVKAEAKKKFFLFSAADVKPWTILTTRNT